MNRRKFIAGATGTAAATIGGAALMGSASATAEADSDYYLGNVSLSSDDGSIDWVAIHGNSSMEWKGLDAQAAFVQIVTSVRVLNASGGPVADKKQINDTGLVDLTNDDWGNHDEELSGNGTRGYVKHGVGEGTGGKRDPSTEWVVIGEKPAGTPGADYGLPNGSIDADKLTVDSDGTAQNYTVEVISEYTVYDSDRNELIGATATGVVDLRVRNIEGETNTQAGDGGASGGASNEGTTLSGS